MEETTASVDIKGYYGAVEVSIALAELKEGRYNLFIASMNQALSALGVMSLRVHKQEKENGRFNFTLSKTDKADFGCPIPDERPSLKQKIAPSTKAAAESSAELE